MTFERVAILGAGLIGGSIGAALRASGTFVRGYDSSRRNGETALRMGCVNEMAETIQEAVSGCELVVLALPVQTIVDLLPLVDRTTAPASTVVDTGSVKRPIMEVVSRLPGSHRVVGGHPIAGKEVSGPTAADRDLFRGRPFVLTSMPDTHPTAIAAALELVNMIGGRPFRMTAAEHDRALARISHLPQIVSTALAACTGAQPPGLFGPGLEDMTRLALSEAAMWRDILLANADNVLEAARELSLELERLTSAVGAGRGDEVLGQMESGRRAALAIRESMA